LFAQDRGAAVLAVFTVFIILSSALAAETFRRAYSERTRTFQLVSSVATARAAASSIELELSEAMRMAVMGAMYEGGMLGENQEGIKERVISALNARIEAGWSYSGFRQIEVYPVGENSVQAVWLPDGSLNVSAFIQSKIVHLSGAEVVGLKAESGAFPRYLRLKHLAEMAEGMLAGGENREQLESRLNEEYACELIFFRILENCVIVADLYGGEILL